MTENNLYSYAPIAGRPALAFPDGKKLAFYIGLNIEHFLVDVPGNVLEGVPDPRNLGLRDYGTRVGIWRMIELFDEVGIRASAITNSDVCLQYPQIIEAGVERGWAWVAHGKTNSVRQTGMSPAAEERFLDEMIKVWDGAVPARPTGWLGPGLSETFATPALLRQIGFTYLLDWCCDDQPFPLNVPGLISVPYSLDINDVAMFRNHPLAGPDYERIVLDQFEVLLADAASSGRVMALPLHTFVTGVPHRFKYLARALREICSHEDVWVCTSDDIAEHYFSTTAIPQAAAV